MAPAEPGYQPGAPSYPTPPEYQQQPGYPAQPQQPSYPQPAPGHAQQGAPTQFQPGGQPVHPGGPAPQPLAHPPQPGQPGGQPGQPQPWETTAPQKASRGSKKLLIGLGTLFLGIVVIGSALLFLRNRGSDGGALGEANEFMSDLDNGRYDSAFDRIPQDCRSDNYAEEVNDVRDRNLAGRLDGFDLELDDRDSDDRAAEVNGTAQLNNSRTNVRIELQSSGDNEWEVCSFEIG